VRDLETPRILAVSCAVEKRLSTRIACAIADIIRHACQAIRNASLPPMLRARGARPRAGFVTRCDPSNRC
jgi:hypothetical protein